MRATGLIILAAIGGLSLSSAQPGRDAPEAPRQDVREGIGLVPDATETAIMDTVESMYEVVSGPAGDRDWERFLGLFAPGAAMTAVIRGADQDSVLRLTPQDYVKRSELPLRRHGFYERQIAWRTQTFGDIAHVWSVYEIRRSPSEAPMSRGVNSIQLIRDPGSADGPWKILSIAWDSEGPDREIPERYLRQR